MKPLPGFVSKSLKLPLVRKSFDVFCGCMSALIIIPLPEMSRGAHSIRGLEDMGIASKRWRIKYSPSLAIGGPEKTLCVVNLFGQWFYWGKYCTYIAIKLTQYPQLCAAAEEILHVYGYEVDPVPWLFAAAEGFNHIHSFSCLLIEWADQLVN
ncbi:hypothetical protein ACH5RR_034203 [Cinchona calisaya]|uniref:Uncharacterized protein n=1 Tax=Cinchona calisaya TaxID=153742 RepID=A0ABD2YES9_9GENT